MAKTKRKHLAAIAGVKGNQLFRDKKTKTTTKGQQVNPSTQSLAGDDEWIEVRKQRVVILIPALSAAHQDLAKLEQGSKEKLPVEQESKEKLQVEQESKENLPLSQATGPMCDAKDVEVPTTNQKGRRVKNKYNRRRNRDFSKVILKFGTWRGEGIMNKIRSPREGEEDLVMPLSSEEVDLQQTRIQDPHECKTLTEAESHETFDAGLAELIPQGDEGHALALSSVKKVRRQRSSQNCLTVRGLEEEIPLILGTEPLQDSVGNAVSKTIMPLEVGLHRLTHQGVEQKDCEKENSLGKEISECDLKNSSQDIGNPEKAIKNQSNSLPCTDGVVSLQQNTLSIPEDIWKFSGVKNDHLFWEPGTSCMPSEPGDSIGAFAKQNFNKMPENQSQSRILVNNEKTFINFSNKDPNIVQKRELYSDLQGFNKVQLVPSTLVHAGGASDGLSCQFCPSSSTNNVIRAVTLKQQLEKAGGLSKWLCSVGLHQFVKIFEKQRFTEVELLHLTMSDLKKMGAYAVGPRRKLIWAINHLGQKLVD